MVSYLEFCNNDHGLFIYGHDLHFFSFVSKSKTQHGKDWKETTKFGESVSLINDVAFYNWQVDSSTLTMSSAGFRNPASYRDYG